MDSIQTTIRLPEALMDALREEAERRGKSRNYVIITLLRRWLREYRS